MSLIRRLNEKSNSFYLVSWEVRELRSHLERKQGEKFQERDKSAFCAISAEKEKKLKEIKIS